MRGWKLVSCILAPFWPGPTLLHSSLQPWTANRVWWKYCSLYLMQVLYNWCRSWKVHIRWLPTYICLVMTRPGATQTQKEKRNQYFLLRSLTSIKDDDMLWMLRKEDISQRRWFSAQPSDIWSLGWELHYRVYGQAHEMFIRVRDEAGAGGGKEIILLKWRMGEGWVSGRMRQRCGQFWIQGWKYTCLIHWTCCASEEEWFHDGNLRRKEVISSKMLRAIHELVAPVMMETKTLKSSTKWLPKALHEWSYQKPHFPSAEFSMRLLH